MKQGTIIEGIFILIIVGMLIYIGHYIHKVPIENLNHLKDSLELVIHKQDSIINKYQQDTINHNKVVKIITTKYETIYKNYNNDTIVSNDSIASYIANKIRNKERYNILLYGK